MLAKQKAQGTKKGSKQTQESETEQETRRAAPKHLGPKRSLIPQKDLSDSLPISRQMWHC